MDFEQFLEQREIHELVTLPTDEKTTPKDIALLLMTLKTTYVKLFLMGERRSSELFQYIREGNEELDRQSGIKIEYFSGNNRELEYNTVGILQLDISVPYENNPIHLKTLAMLCEKVFGI